MVKLWFSKNKHKINLRNSIRSISKLLFLKLTSIWVTFLFPLQGTTQLLYSSAYYTLKFYLCRGSNFLYSFGRNIFYDRCNETSVCCHSNRNVNGLQLPAAFSIPCCIHIWHLLGKKKGGKKDSW